MANKRDNGSGTIYQRPNGSWQARIYIDKKEDGSPKFKYITGKTQADVKRKIKEYNQSEKIETKKVSVWASQRIMCKRFSTKSRISRFQCA